LPWILLLFLKFKKDKNGMKSLIPGQIERSVPEIKTPAEPRNGFFGALFDAT